MSAYHFPVPITRLCSDSRAIQPGDTFVAMPGDGGDGRRHIPEAIERGATSVLWERENFSWNPAWNIPNLGETGLRTSAGFWADALYDHPSRDLWMIGITGTNGKTSCSHWIAQCLNTRGRRSAIIGTLGSGFYPALEETGYTTPDAITLQTQLRDFRQQGARAVVMEVSSHGLEQGRTHGVVFDVALLTNLSRDHLDYHGDMQNYARAKASLFEKSGLQYALLNLDDTFGQELSQKLGCSGVQKAGYGFDHVPTGCEIAILGKNLRLGNQGMRFEVATPWGKGALTSSLLGRFNASNLLGSLAALLVSGIELDAALAALSQVQPVTGRLQKLGGGHQPTIVVDYAHTPDALEKVLTTLRELLGAQGRLICVFGCGGNRDPGKRPEMGHSVSSLADHAIVTSDNPRREDPRHIIEQIVAGMGGNHEIETDRAAAIDRAIRLAKPADIVLIAGKGHERYQEISGIKYPFNDLEVAARLLQELRT